MPTTTVGMALDADGADPCDEMLLSTMRMYATQHLKKIVPAEYVATATCFQILSFGRGVDVVVCTANGELLEFAQGLLQRYCQLGLDGADSVQLLCLAPGRWFYLVRGGERLLLVCQDLLKVVCQHEDVSKFCVRDFEGSGFPQLKLWTRDCEQPCVISDLTSCGRPIPGTSLLDHRLHADQLRVRRAQDKLTIRKQFRQIVADTSNHADISEVFGLVHVVGEEVGSRTQTSHISERAALHITDHWQRVHNEKWIVGMSVNNSSPSCVSDMSLFLRQPSSSFQYTVSCYRASGDDWQRCSVGQLPGRTLQLVLVVLDLPLCVEPCIRLSGSLHYSVGSAKGTDADATEPCVLQLPEIHLKAAEVLAGTLSPLHGPAITTTDLTAVVQTSVRRRLHITLSVPCPLPLSVVCCRHLGFREVGAGWLARGGELLKGLGVQPQYCVEILARDNQRASLLVQALCDSMLGAHVAERSVCSSCPRNQAGALKTQRESRTSEGRADVELSRETFADLLKKLSEKAGASFL